MRMSNSLGERHLAAGDKLAELEHKLYRANLPADYEPLGNVQKIAPLVLDARQRLELKGEVLRTKIQVLQLGAEIQQELHGRVDEWLIKAQSDLQAELDGLARDYWK